MVMNIDDRKQQIHVFKYEGSKKIMKNQFKYTFVLLLSALLLLSISPVDAQKAKKAAKVKGLKPQATCPIMGGKINKKQFVDIDGNRIYVCCPGCISKIKADPKAALAKLASLGEKAEVRLSVCKKCGDIKGTKQCCAKGAAKCAGCGLNKGSVGCCKHLKPAAGEKEVLICGKCGEVKGTKKCCAKGAKKCTKCKLNKGSVACCKKSATSVGCGCSKAAAQKAAKCGCAKGACKCKKPVTKPSPAAKKGCNCPSGTGAIDRY
jgi:hypothetical protein